MKKREISDIEKEECKLLKQLFNSKKKELGLSQAKIAGLIGVTQAAINHYLNGTNALNASIASEFAKVLGVPVGSFSWRLEKEINEMSNSLIISGGVHNNTSYTLNQNSVSKPTKEELSDADKHFLKSMPLLDIDMAVRHLANPDKDRTQIQSDGDRAATFIPHSGHTVGVRMADDVEFAGIKRGDILIVEPHIPPRDKDLVLICIDNTGYLRGIVGKLSIAIDGTHTFIYDGGAGVPLPDGAFIAGVVVEVKRRLIPTDILLSRLDPDYNIHQSKQR
ncbi:helix-turn-helix domain-containing protein [Neisseria polysaccharea]|uniref:helix-turn-helix domain-containing protein n=1 Tax=Neisseria polysaccharea TaxID=489 RepID=UPI0027DEB14F|nr:helix-turn-helix domain-containing protein [Neisseria polysaccharea]